MILLFHYCGQMRVLIDTSIFVIDFLLKRPLFRTLLCNINIDSETMQELSRKPSVGNSR
jgi:hypothetical protein